MRPVAIFRFSPTEGPARFGEWLDAQRRPWQLVALDAGDPVPADPRAFAGIGMMGGPMSANDPLPWIAPLSRAAARRRRRRRSGDRPLPRRPVDSRRRSAARVDARADGRRSAGSTSTPSTRRRATTGSAAARASPRSSGTTTRSTCRRAPRACCQRVQSQPGLRDRRPARRLPVPRRDDARAGGDVVRAAAATNCRAARRASRQSRADILRDLDARVAR